MTLQIAERTLDELRNVGVTSLIHSRFLLIANQAEKMCSEDIVDAFVTDQASDSGRILLNLNFFSENYILEAKNFQFAIDIDITLLRGSLEYVNIKADNYMLGENPTDVSNVLVVARFSTGTTLQTSLTATSNNCTNLFRIINERILPNVVKPPL